eukprot:g2513.t1
MNSLTEADWFYVPLHATCVYVKLNENVSEELVFNMDNVSNHFIWDPMMDFLKASRYFHRYEGADHIFLFADGQGPRIWDSYDLLRSESVFLSPESRCPTWNEPLRRYVDVKRCLSSWKDLVIPGHTDYARIQYMKSHNKRSAERRLLMTFHGRAPELHGAYSHCAARGALMQLGRARGLDEGVDIGGFVGDYPERKGDSHFCLVPAGTSPWTNHLYESFYAGCIPVILSDEYEVAFADDLPWHKFSIKWPESQVCDDADCTSSTLYNYLRDFAQEHPQQLWEMKRELEIHSCYFNWYSTDQSCSPYFLLHKHLKHLADQRSRRKSREPRVYAAEESHPRMVSPHPDPRWALVVGNEERGVSEEVLRCCNDFLRVPQVRGASLNVAHAAAICIYELAQPSTATVLGKMQSGWVNIKLDQTDLLHCIVKECPRGQVPFFCAWYSGGFSPKDGEKLLAPLLNAVKEAGMKDAAIFHFPDAYGIAEEGREPWAKYIDLLVEEVNQVAGENRPLVLFGHSRGAAPATCLAEFQEQVQSSKFLSEMLNLMRAQYRDAMYPDPERDFGSMPVPIMAFSPLLDDSCQPEHCKAWGRLTEDFQLENLNAGHMDCLQARAAPLPPDLKLELHCPLLIPEILQMTPAMEETLRNFAQVQANQRGEGTSCELFEKISQEMCCKGRVDEFRMLCTDMGHIMKAMMNTKLTDMAMGIKLTAMAGHLCNLPNDLEAGSQSSPLQSRTLAEAWAESNWNVKKVGRRSAQSQYVQPRMQIKRDFDLWLEAKRVAMMFEHLEHIDDDLSWGGLQSAASAAIKPLRLLKTCVILSPFAVSALTPPHLGPGELGHSSFYELTRTLLTHACAASLSYLVLGFAFQVVTMAALRISRLQRWRTAEKIIYLNGILFQEERAAVSDTRVLLARPCTCILLLLFCNALKKMLEFSFLRSKLALNFETDVLVNAFERAALERVADFACLETAPAELLEFLQQTTVLPILQEEMPVTNLSGRDR